MNRSTFTALFLCLAMSLASGPVSAEGTPGTSGATSPTALEAPVTTPATGNANRVGKKVKRPRASKKRIARRSRHPLEAAHPHHKRLKRKRTKPAGANNTAVLPPAPAGMSAPTKPLAPPAGNP